MNYSQSFKLALKSILASKMRSFLTMLGIIIGVGSVIILISLMQGLTDEVVSQFESMGTNVLNVSIQGRGSSRKVDTKDMYELYENNSDIFMGISPTVTMSSSVKYENTSYSSTSVTGVSEQYNTIKDLSVIDGRFIGYADLNNYNKVCVIGSYLNQICYNGKGVGNTIKINGNKFNIIGVLDEMEDSSEGSGDDCIFIPYTTASKLSYGNISSYVFCTKDSTYNERATNIIDNKLYEVMQNEDYYTISDMQSLTDTVTEMTDMMTLVLVGIAGISLLVGGIGIMNIMLVSVTERTKEIGIRKSLGAKRKDIMSQFIIEAATTSALGGVLGILLGISLSGIIGNLIGLNATPTMIAILISFSISVFIGIFFGFLPANKASKLNPIDALRYE